MNPAPLTAARLYKRLLGYATPYWRVFTLAVLAMLGFAATDTGFAALMKPMLDGNFIERDPATIRFVPLALVGLFVVRGVTGFVSRYAMSWIGRRVIQRLRHDLFHRLLHLPAQYFDRNPSGRLLSHLTFDVEQVAEATTNAVTILIRDSLTMLFLLLYMFWISPWLTLLFLIVGPVLVGLIRYVSLRFRRISRRIQDSMGELTQFSEEAIQGQRLVKSFNGQTWQERLFEDVNERNRRLHLKMAAAAGASTPIVQLIAACILALVVYLATLESVTREISVGSFVSFIAAMMLLMQPLKHLTNINASIQRGVSAARSIFQVLDEPTEPDQGRLALRHARGAIEFRNVSFAYDAQKGDVLQDISFSIAPGQTVALVGRSGSGKTTLAHLLLRFYDPREGAVCLDFQVRERAAHGQQVVQARPQARLQPVALLQHDPDLPDQGVRAATFVGWAFPPFILALILMNVFYAWLGWFPPERMSILASPIVNSEQFVSYTGFLTVDALLNGNWRIFSDAVRHLVLPEKIAGTGESLDFLAEEISPDTFVNIMDQYRPCYRAGEYPPLDRRLRPREFEAARAHARQRGLHRLA